MLQPSSGRPLEARQRLMARESWLRVGVLGSSDFVKRHRCVVILSSCLRHPIVI